MHQLSETLIQKIRNIDDSILSQNETQLTQTLLHGNQNYHSSINRRTIISTIKYLISTERFKCLVFFIKFLLKRMCTKLVLAYGYYIGVILFLLLLSYVN